MGDSMEFRAGGGAHFIYTIITKTSPHSGGPLMLSSINPIHMCVEHIPTRPKEW